MILALDQGTTGSTALVFDDAGRVAGRAYSEFPQHFPRPGWVEHDATDIWEVTRRVGHEALNAAGVDGRALAGIGIANQRETVVAWDRATGEPLHRALVWQDRRTAERCDELRAAGREPLVRERTGLVLDPYFSGTKIEWLIRHGGVDPARAAFGTVDSWLVHKLTGRHATDYSNASRTMLFDIGALAWDEDLCELLGVPLDSLPEICPSAHVYGETGEFGGSVPVAGVQYKDLDAELAQTRKRGFAISRSELIEGAVAIATPFFDRSGCVAGSIGVFGPEARLTAARQVKIAKLLMNDAMELSQALGFGGAAQRRN